MNKVYHGWLLVGGLSATELVSWGVLVYGFSVFVVPMRAELGWTTAEMNAAYAVGVVVSGVVAIPVGRWLEVRGARGVMTMGSCVTVLMLLAWSQVQSLPMLFAIFVLGGVAMAATLYEPAFAVTTLWFSRRRAQAVLVLTIFGGLASVVFVPLTGALVTHLGWRDALVTLAVIAGLIGLPIHGLLLRRRPPPLDDKEGAAPVGAPDAVVNRRAVVRSPSFRWLTLCLVLTTSAKLALSVILVAYLTDRGYPLSQATLAAGGVGLFQVAGRLLLTALRRRLSEHRAIAALFGLQGLAMLLPLTTSGHGRAATVTIVLFVVLFGIGFGLPELMRGTLLVDFYGTANYASINGVIAAFVTGSRAAGPLLAGIASTALGSYVPVFVAAAALAVGSAIALGLAHRSRLAEARASVHYSRV